MLGHFYRNLSRAKLFFRFIIALRMLIKNVIKPTIKIWDQIGENNSTIQAGLHP